MKKHWQIFALIFTTSLFLTSCFSDSKEAEKEDNTISINLNGKDGESIDIEIDGKEDIEKAMKGLQKSLEGLGDELKGIDINIKDENGEKIEVIAAAELKKILPNRIAGLEKTASSSEKTGAFGFKVATAEATYQEDDELVQLEIVDVGGMGKMASKFVDLTDMEVDKENSNGDFERTVQIDGHKAIEKYDASQAKYELTAFVNSRFVVKIEGKNVKLSKLKSALEDIIDDIEGL